MVYIEANRLYCSIAIEEKLFVLTLKYIFILRYMKIFKFKHYAEMVKFIQFYFPIKYNKRKLVKTTN